MIDSSLVILLSYAIKTKINTDVIKTIRSIRKNASCTLIFLAITTEKPRISKMFVMFEPIIIPETISEFPCNTANVEEINSGRLVPIATMVTPTRNGEILSQSPIFSAEVVNHSADFASRNSVKINKSTEINKSI